MVLPERLRIATRKSPLAQRQAGLARAVLLQQHPQLEVELVGMVSSGDHRQARFGEDTKAMFTRELEQALLDGHVDLAVHSMKDVSIQMPAGLMIGAYLPRGSTADALVGNVLVDLATGARVGTSSLRRRCQLLALRPDIKVLESRGNIDTRLAGLANGKVDALLLAAAGLERLGYAARITERFVPRQMLPAVGQGAIGLQVRKDRESLLQLLASIDDNTTRACVEAERAFSRELGGNCHMPIAAYAQSCEDRLHIEGMVGLPDGSQVLRAGVRDAAAGEAGRVLGECLRAAGAGPILARLSG